jgi:predicted glycosyltransferase
MRFLFYSHDGLGLGHTRRNLAIAAALTELAPDASVLLATGADYVNRLGLPRHVDILKLPGLRKIANGQYRARHLRLPFEEIRALRAEMLLTAAKSFAPSVTLVDKHPFGARGEFRAGLDALKESGGKAVLGLRDILDEPERVLNEWRPYRMQQRIADFYDEIFVYGHRAVLDPIAAYDFPASARARTHFCGYVANRERKEDLDDVKWARPTNGKPTQPVVLATAGGGEDGFVLLESFIRTAANAPWQGVVVTGPMTPDEQINTLRRLAAENGVALKTFVPHLSGMFWTVNALVCMGGYNTLGEALSKGLPTVCVPRVAPRSEQWLRALAFERLGLLHVLPPGSLTCANLSEAIAMALAESREELLGRVRRRLSFDGAQQAAGRLLALAHESSLVASRHSECASL